MHHWYKCQSGKGRYYLPCYDSGLGDGVGGHGREKRGSKTSDMCSWVKDGQSHIVGIEVLPTHCLAFERSFVNPFICKSSVKW